MINSTGVVKKCVDKFNKTSMHPRRFQIYILVVSKIETKPDLKRKIIMGAR